MTRARTLADLGSQSLATDAEVSAAIAASGKYGSGYTDAVATAASGDPTSVTINRAVRVVNNTEHEFTNLTFNMPSNANTDTSDWTDPGNGNYKWSYVYIRPSDDKFFLSNNAPAIGQNYRTIGGDDVVYLFPVYCDDNSVFRFTATNNDILIDQFNASYTYQSSRNVPGLRFAYQSNISTGTTQIFNYNIDGYIPQTAINAEFGAGFTWNARNDSGGVAQARFLVRLNDDTATARNLINIAEVKYSKTPTLIGDYYPEVHGYYYKRFTINPQVFDLTSGKLEIYYSHGFGDGWNNIVWNMHQFTDRNIF